MDWDAKFTSIVQDTESNLDKIKRRLNCARLPVSASMSNLDYYSNPEMKVFENGLEAEITYDHQTFPNEGKYSDKQLVPLSETFTTHGPESSPAVVALLTNQLQSQAKFVEKLSRSLHRLDKEKSKQELQIKDLTDELRMVKYRLQEKGIDFVTEKKMETWRQDMSQELQLMHSQMLRLHNNEEHRSLQDSQKSTISKDFYELKRSVEDETHSLRRDVNTLKNRMTKLEIDVNGMIADTKDYSRRQELQERFTNDAQFEDSNLETVNDLVESNHSARRNLQRCLHENDQGKMQITELSSNIKHLNGKIANLATDMPNGEKMDHKKSHKCRRSSHRHHKPRRYKEKVSSLDSDLDLSDSDYGLLDPHSIYDGSYALNIAARHDEEDLYSHDLDLRTEELDITSTEDLLSLDKYN